MKPNRAQRVLVIGLDCAAPAFIFGPNAFHLPNIHALMRDGCWARLRSCDPPITVPAWAVMTSGKDPGELGIYGFRNRTDHSYAPMSTASSFDVTAPRVWDDASRAGKKVIVIGVPLTWPPRPVKGALVSDFLTPDSAGEYTYPKSLQNTLDRELGEYILDVKDYRTEDKRGLLPRIHALMHNRFDAAELLLRMSDWDFAMLVEMGMDRLHHAFWRYCDPLHPRYAEGNPFEHVFREYYEAVDERIGKLLECAGENTAVLVVSDHGAKPMVGGFRINQWLLNEGYLALKHAPKPDTPFTMDLVDWPRTRVWSEGGYYARIFINRAGREPQGCVPANAYEPLRDELITKLEARNGPDGLPMNNRVYRPESRYATVTGVAPDLLAYFGNLSWRSAGSLGHDSVFARTNDTGPDDANHDFEGIFVLRAPHLARHGDLGCVSILDVAPTLCALLDITPSSPMTGTNWIANGATVHSGVL